MKQQIIKEIHEWMETFVEKSNPKFGNMPPCPYARQARLQNKIDIKDLDDDYLVCLVDAARTWTDEFDVVIFVETIVDRYDPSELSAIVEEVNKRVMPMDIVCLEDHPAEPEIINGVQMNNGKYVLVLMQRLSKINDASKHLESTSYYKHWTKENLDDVKNWRFEKD
tara:strand:- start:15535 stop:16035 length:501 start_codon:yes stop_codon:yes gene_type:complete